MNISLIITNTAVILLLIVNCLYSELSDHNTTSNVIDALRNTSTEYIF